MLTSLRVVYLIFSVTATTEGSRRGCSRRVPSLEKKNSFWLVWINRKLLSPTSLLPKADVIRLRLSVILTVCVPSHANIYAWIYVKFLTKVGLSK